MLFSPRSVIVTGNIMAFNTELSNLVPRSLITEAEGEIWSSKNYIFFLIG